MLVDPTDPITFPSSSANFQRQSDMEIMPFVARTCLICGATAESKHFNALACNACGAFFRRSVSQAKRYVCQTGKKCQITKKKSGHLCAYCRFKKCIQAGMLMSSVVKSAKGIPSSGDDNSLLNVLLKSQRATFTNRYASHLKAYSGCGEKIKMGIQNPSFSDTNLTVACEFPVLIEYLRMCGFENLGLTRTEMIELAKDELFYPWVSYQSVIATLKNNGFKVNVTYFLDENHHKTDEKTMLEYVQTCKTMVDYQFAARSTMLCCKENMDAATKLHSLKLDEVDLAILFQIISLKAASKLPKKGKNFEKMLNSLFMCLQDHFQQNYDNVGTRMGNIIMALSIIQNASKFLIDYVMMQQLNGYDSVMSELRNKQVD